MLFCTQIAKALWTFVHGVFVVYGGLHIEYSDNKDKDV